MDWVYLILAGIFEIGWASGLKYTEGFSKLVPTVIVLLLMVISFGLLSIAMQTIPIGTAYAVWTGIGAVGVAVIGILYLKESSDTARVISIMLIIVGIIGLKLSHG